MFQRILVPLDGSSRAEHALPIAARLARAAGGTIILMRVVGIPIGYSPAQAHSGAFAQDLLNDQTEDRAYLASVRRSPLLEGIHCETVVLSGTPARVILDNVPTYKVELIVLCSRGQTETKRWIMGSVAQKIACHSEVPVLILREDGKASLEPYPDPSRPLRMYRALVALDSSHPAEQALEPVSQIVAALSAPAKGILHMVHVVLLPSPAIAFDDTDMSTPALQEKAFFAAKKYLRHTSEDMRDTLPKDVNVVINWSVVVETDIAQVLIDVAETGTVFEGAAIAGGCDLIALTTHGHGGFQDWSMGTVAERVLHGTRLPVLIVRPHQVIRSSVRLVDEETAEAEA